MATGKPLGNMIITLDLDSSAFSKGLTGAKNAVNHQMKAMKSQMQVLNASGNSIGALQAKYNGLGAVLQANEKQVDLLTKSYKDSFDANGNATVSTAKYADQLNQAKARSASFEAQMKTTVGQIARSKVETEGITGSLKQQSEQWIKSGERIDTFGQKVSGVGTAMTIGVTAPIVAGAAAVTKAAMSWESDFAGVKKTNDEIIDSTGRVVYSYDDLESGLRNLATQLPSTHKEIAAVAEAGGQLGIASDDVVGFTKVMIDMGESTNLSAETAATELARFANITQMSHDKFSNLGSAIVDLGNNFATTEAEISAMALRLAGAGSQIGMSEGDILGFAAALSSVGVEAEAGGSAFSKVMVQMQLAVEKGSGAFSELKGHAADQGVAWEQLVSAVRNGGKELTAVSKQMGFTSSELKKMYKEADKSKTSLEDFANTAGMTSDEFSKMFKSNPSEAIMKFVEGLSHAEEKGSSAIKILDDMDIKEVRLRDSLLRAANASGVFTNAVETGNEAFKKNTALTDEANKRYETTESKLKMLRNEAVNAAIDLGGPFVDALRDGLEASKPLIKGLGNLASAFSSLSEDQQRNIIKWLGIAAAAGPTLKLLGSGVSVIGKVTQSTGRLTGSLVELAAKAAEKKAMDTFSASMATAGATAAKTAGPGGVGSLIPALGQTAGAASSAAGASGVGAMTTSLGLLGPALLGVVGVGGALAVGYGAWKTFGEEAWNSSQRVKTWGTDVGTEVDNTLTKVKEKTEATSGQFGLMADGLSQNTEPMVNNFVTIGETIESSLTKKVEGLDSLIKNLPGTVTDTMKQIVENEKEMNQSALENIQENNERIKEIREKASKENRDISIAEAQMISDISKNTAEEYVNTLDVSAEQKKAILNSMTGDVSNATKEQAETWLRSLGEQRNASQNHSAQMRKEQEKWLEEWGYNLDGEFAQKYLSEWDKINGATVEGFDSQIAAIVQKYPELTNKIHLATGEVITASTGATQYLIEDNQKLLDNAGYMADKLAENAKKNAETLKWVAKTGGEVAYEWNSLELLDKEGNVKSNAAEIIQEASKDITKWNNLKMILHDANIDTNAKKMIGEAAIANELWRGMAWEDKEAVLQDEFSVNIYKALESSGKWDELTFEQKKAVLYSNTPEIMAETLFNLGLWNDYQPEIKNLNAENYQFYETLSKSEEKLKVWNETPVDIKELFADNYDFLNKIFTSEESFTRWNAIPNSEKKLLADNMDFLTKISTSKETLDRWNQLPTDQKNILANNEDLLNKIFASKESFNAWKAIPDPVKRMLGDNVDILTKVKDGTISIEDYNKNVLPLLKKLFGDNSSLTGAVGDASAAIDNYNKNIFPNDKTAVGHDKASQAAKDAFEAFNIFQTKIPDKITKTVSADFIGPMPNAKGTNFHPGGAAMVNDQKGSTYEELVTLPNGKAFIPKGRNVVLDLPRGSKVLKASRTKQLVSRYADGVGDITTISTVPNLDVLIQAIMDLTATLKVQTVADTSASQTVIQDSETEIPEPITPDSLIDKSDQYYAIGTEWLSNLMNGWNSIVPQFKASEVLFISNFMNALSLRNNPNYLQGVTWNRNLMNGWNSLTSSFITTINAFCNQALVTLRNYNGQMHSSGRNWQQNNLNGWNSLYSTFISRVNQLGIDSINNLRGKNGDFYNAGTFLLQSLINGTNSMGGALASTMNGVANKMVSGIGKGVNGVISGVNYVLKEVESSDSIGSWTVPQYARGIDAHPEDGPAIVNDQPGTTYKEIIQRPNGETFIPKERNAMLWLEKGSKVINASKTKQILKVSNKDIPHYKNGIGDVGVADFIDDKEALKRFLSSNVDYESITNPWRQMTTSAVNKMAEASNQMVQNALSDFFSHGNFDGALYSGGGAFNNVYSYLVDVAKKVMTKFPGLVPTSGFRSGDPHYHGKHQAIDLAFPGIVGDSRYTTIANYAFEKFKNQVGYVITNGRVRDRMGISGTGASGNWVRWPDNDHFDHIHLNGAFGGGGLEGSSGNVERWRSVATKALRMEGQLSAANLNALLNQMRTESNGDPNAINMWDINAKNGVPSKGLMQVIDPTFRSYARSPHNKNIFDPMSNILASIRYTKSRYGSLLAGWRGVGYADGGLITKDGLYRAGEGNKPEMVIPLTRKTRAIELMGQALAFLSGEGNRPSGNTVSADNSAELLTLIKQQQEQHGELMMILKAILSKDSSISPSEIAHVANKIMGSDLNKLRYTNGGV